MPGYRNFGYFGVFPGAVVAGGPLGPVVTGASDAAVLADIQARLLATGEFTDVSRNNPFEKGNHPSTEAAAADVSPGAGGTDLDTSDEWADVRIEHDAKATITLAVREQDEATRFNRLDRLANLVRDTLNGQSLAGCTIPARTLVRRWTYPVAEPPEQRVALGLEYELLVDTYAGFDTTLVN